MLTDPLDLIAIGEAPFALVAVTPPLALQDLAPGKTVRSANSPSGGLLPEGKITMTINHSESRENKGMITDRASIRLECRKTLESGDSSVAQFTLTGSYPRLGYTLNEMIQIANALIGTFVTDEADTYALLKRVLNGEP